MNKTALFEVIKQHYKTQDQEKIVRGQLPMRSTEVGFWGVSNLDDVYAFFEKKQFPKHATFIDIGCGDGRVVAVASLFVKAFGVEYDGALAQTAQQSLDALGLNADVYQGDVLEIDLTPYDVLYMYADRNFSYLKEKLLNELSGTLYLYHDTYHPTFLNKQQTTWIGQIPIFTYSAPTLKE